MSKEYDLELSNSLNQNKPQDLKNIIEISATHIDNNEPINDSFNYDESNYFLLQNLNCKPLNELEIKIGTNVIARFSCACHKCNIATQMAINNHEPFKALLKSCWQFARSNNKSIIQVKENIEKKQD